MYLWALPDFTVQKESVSKIKSRLSRLKITLPKLIIENLRNLEGACQVIILLWLKTETVVLVDDGLEVAGLNGGFDCKYILFVHSVVLGSPIR